MRRRIEVLALASWTLLACATGTRTAQAPLDRTAPAAQADAIVVNETFTEQIDRDCSYRATVRGVLVPTPDVRVASAPVRYRPDLRVDAVLDCPVLGGGQTHQTLRGEPLSRDEIEQAVHRAARITVASGDVACFYAPRFRFDGTRLAGQTLARWCRIPPSARGGGPLATETPVQELLPVRPPASVR